MKAFAASTVVAIGIAIGAAVVLNLLSWDSASVYQSENVRLDDQSHAHDR